jgi:hypothetical protein
MLNKGMPKKYRIYLSGAERVELQSMINRGKAAAGKRLRAQMLLAADESHQEGAMVDGDIARAFGASVRSVERVRCALAEHGLQIAVHGWPPHRRQPRGKLDGWAEAHLVAATCSAPPAGAARWTLQLLGDHLVKLSLVESISAQTIGRALKKTPSSPGR